MELCAPPPSSRRRCVGGRAAVHGRRPHCARPEPRPNHRYARQQGRWHPPDDRELLHRPTTPRQHRRRAARRRPARCADSAVSTRLAQGGLGRGHGNGGLRRHQRHLEHKNRGTTRTLLAARRCALLTAEICRPPPSLHPARAQAAATLALRRASTPSTTRVAAHAPPLHQPQPQDSSTRTHAALLTAHTAPARPAPPLVAAPLTPDTTHERQRTTTKRCCVPKRTQSRRRRSIEYGGTGPPPRQRDCRLVPLMRAWFTPPHSLATRPRRSLALSLLLSQNASRSHWQTTARLSAGRC